VKAAGGSMPLYARGTGTVIRGRMGRNGMESIPGKLLCVDEDLEGVSDGWRGLESLLPSRRRAHCDSHSRGHKLRKPGLGIRERRANQIIAHRISDKLKFQESTLEAGRRPVYAPLTQCMCVAWIAYETMASSTTHRGRARLCHSVPP
jgi:hypothetical protein